MKKFLTLILAFVMGLACLSFAGCNSCSKKNILIVYTEAGFAPWEYKNPGSRDVVGVDMEIAKYIAIKYGYELKIVDGSFDTIVAGIAEDNALGIAGISWTAKRAEAVEFSDFYWGEAFQTVVYLKNSNPTLEDGVFLKSNFAGKNVVYQTGTTSHLTITENEVAWGVAGKRSFQDVAVALEEVKTDATLSTYLIVDSQVAAQLVAQNPALGYATIEGVEAESYGIVAKKGNKFLINQVNAALAELLVEDENGKNQIEKWYDMHSAIAPAD